MCVRQCRIKALAFKAYQSQETEKAINDKRKKKKLLTVYKKSSKERPTTAIQDFQRQHMNQNYIRPNDRYNENMSYSSKEVGKKIFCRCVETLTHVAFNIL